MDRKPGFLSLRTKLAFSFALLAIVSVGTMTYVYYQNTRTQLLQDIRQRLHDSVAIAALQVDAELDAQLTDPAQPTFNLSVVGQASASLLTRTSGLGFMGSQTNFYCYAATLGLPATLGLGSRVALTLTPIARFDLWSGRPARISPVPGSALGLRFELTPAVSLLTEVAAGVPLGGSPGPALPDAPRFEGGLSLRFHNARDL